MSIRFVVGVVVGIIVCVCLGIFLCMGIPSEEKMVVAVGDHSVLYSDNTAEFVFRDNYNGALTVYRTPVEPILEDSYNAAWYAPELRLPVIDQLGGNWERVVFSVQDMDACIHDIVVADRLTHTTHTAHTDFCILKTLDEHDFTRFWATTDETRNEEGARILTVGIGDYLTGSIIASTTVEIPIWSDGESWIGWYDLDTRVVASDWELTKIVFAFTAGPECGDYRGVCDTPAFIYMYDLETGEVRDVTPEKGVTFLTLHPQDPYNYNQEMSYLQYIRDPQDPNSGRFIILGENGIDNPYAIIDVD